MLDLDQIETAEATTTAFHKLYYNDYENTWETTTFLGTKILKNPCDLWIYQELIWGIKPDLIIETGTAHGGSGLYLASLCDLVHNGMVITIDIVGTAVYPYRPQHPRLIYLKADSSKSETASFVRDRTLDPKRVMVILDSNHEKDHVLNELDIWGPFVTPGSYLIVEDTNIHGNPVVPEHGPGPHEALEEWLPNHPEFVREPRCERYRLTFNPGGYLRRVP